MIDVKICAFDNVPINVSDKSGEETVIAVDFRAGQAQLLLSMDKAAELHTKLGTELAWQRTQLVARAVKISLGIVDKRVKAVVGIKHDLPHQEVHVEIVSDEKDAESLKDLRSKAREIASAMTKSLGCLVKIMVIDQDLNESLGYEYRYFYEREEAPVEASEACGH